MKTNFFYKIINGVKKITNKREIDLSSSSPTKQLTKPLTKPITTSLTNPTTKLNLTRDEIKLKLWGLELSVKRESTSDTPTELSVIVPRAEYRNQEIILNSITIVLAPRHPSADTSDTSDTSDTRIQRL